MTERRQIVFVGNPSERQQSGKIFRHIVMFKMYGGMPKTPGTPETSEERKKRKAFEALVDKTLALMAAMCEDDTVLHYEVGVSQDDRKGTILFEFVDFDSEDAFEAFKTTEGHLTFANFIRNHADWIIADYFVAV